jgi:hypothetical protein
MSFKSAFAVHLCEKFTVFAYAAAQMVSEDIPYAQSEMIFSVRIASRYFLAMDSPYMLLADSNTTYLTF